jgi:hypothetical protein
LKKTLYIAAILFAFACNNKADSDAIIAQVGDKVLYLAELQDIIPDDSSPEDSLMLGEKYVKDWIVDQVVVKKAEENLSEEQKNFEELIDVSNEEIEKYYNDNIQNFELRDYIVKVKFCALASDSKDLKQLKKLFYSSDPKDFLKWEALCIEKQASYYIDEDRWMLWEDLVKKIPIEVFDVESFLTRNKSVEVEKNGNTHLIAFLDYQLSGSRSPLSFEKERIKAMIINKRKLDLISKMKEDLYQQAVSNNEVENYLNKK